MRFGIWISVSIGGAVAVFILVACWTHEPWWSATAAIAWALAWRLLVPLVVRKQDRFWL
jgi:hypothetical protein